MQTKNNFSSSVSFNIFYLAEPNKSVTHTHTHTFRQRSKSLYKGDSGAPGAGVGPPFQASARSFQSSLQMLFHVCITEPVKQEINSSKYNHVNRIKNEEEIV